MSIFTRSHDNGTRFSLIVKHKDDTGIWRNRTVCSLGSHPSPAAAVEAWLADLASLRAEAAAWRADVDNVRKAAWIRRDAQTALYRVEDIIEDRTRRLTLIRPHVKPATAERIGAVLEVPA